ncbi:hypothetical protein ACERII_23255 [Evansella sp. AB-rgal1]|uniref:hypothetical protein n=1 Tax=Evansella sp. AB-rgal1 TaxID=3242696 RepID=UPI00359EC21E
MFIRLTKKAVMLQLMILIFLILFILPIAYTSISDASETIKHEIYDFARGSYDILVRPSESRSLVEKKMGLVEENYLGLGDGGITISQWDQIKNHEDVEIAAPVAAVGLFTAPEITVQLPPSPPDTSLKYEAYPVTTDGIKEYQLSPPLAAYTIYNEIGNQQLIEVMDDDLLEIYFSSENPNYALPPSFHQVVAVDIEEEKALTGIPFPNLQYSSGLAPIDYVEIPIISLNHVTSPVKTILKIGTLNDEPGSPLDNIIKHYLSITDVDVNDFKFIGYRYPDIHVDLLEELGEIELLSSEEYVLDFTQKVTPFYDNFLFTDDEYKVFTYEDRNSLILI